MAGVLADRVRPERTVYAGLAPAALAVMLLGVLRDVPLFVAIVATGAGIRVVWTNTWLLRAAPSVPRR